MKNRTKRKLSVTACVVLLVLATAAATVFALYRHSFTVENQFESKYLNVQLTEAFDPPKDWNTNDPVAKEVTYTNTGTLDALLRVQAVENWVAADNTLLSNVFTPAGGAEQDVAVKNWNAANGLNTANWTLIDGWYYYNKALKPGESIQVLDSIQMNASLTPLDAYETATYKLSFLNEQVKSDAAEAKNLWGLEPAIQASGTVVWTAP